MGRDLVVRVQLPEASPDTYMRLTRACRTSARRILSDPLLEELAAAVAWQLVDQASRARLDGHVSVSPILELEPDHVEVAREFARRGAARPVAEGAAPDVEELLERCTDRVASAFGATAGHARAR